MKTQLDYPETQQKTSYFDQTDHTKSCTSLVTYSVLNKDLVNWLLIPYLRLNK